jgi:hypothetical protein
VNGSHFSRWGALYLLVLLFAGSWVGQFLAQLPKIGQEGMAEFWAATFENWQSEFLQLAVQAGVVVALADRVFRVSTQDRERIERKLDELLRRTEGR